MAFSTGLACEIRTTASAGNIGGGFFVPGASGTDYSQQDAPQWSNLACTAAGAGNVLATASAAATMVGNFARVVSGTNITAGWWEIESVVAGVSITFKTNAAAASIATGASGDAVINIGGAISLGSSTANYTDDSLFDVATVGTVFHVKNGTYTMGVAISNATNGTVTSLNRIVGYNTTRGDTCVGTNRPQFVFTGNNGWTSGQYWQLENLRMESSTTSTGGLFTGTTGVRILNGQFHHLSSTAGNFAITGTPFCYKVEGVSLRGRAFQMNSAYHRYIDCVGHSSDSGVLLASATMNVALTNCLFFGNVTAAININTAFTTGHLSIEDCTLYGSENKIGTGVSIPASSSNVFLHNNIIAGFVTGVSHGTAGQNATVLEYNNFYNNTSDVSNVTKGASDTAVNQAFTSATQVTGTTATTSSGQLVDSGKDFTALGVTAGEYLHILSGTGVTAGKYKITAVGTTTLTTSPALSNNATADKSYSIHTVNNFTVGSAMNGLNSSAYPVTPAISYREQGAFQRQLASSVDPGIANVRNGTNYTIEGSAKVGTAYIPTAANVRNGVNVDATTGTCYVPTAANVIEGVNVDATVGTYEEALEATVLKGITYGAAGAKTGTLEVGGSKSYVVQL